VIKYINLLLFSAKTLSFGVYAEQVEELLEAKIFSEPEETGSESTIPYKGQDIRVTDLSGRLELEERQKITMSAGHRREDFSPLSSPRILIIKCQNGGYVGVRVENLNKLLTISIDQVHALPIIMQKKKRIQAIWGIALVDNQPIILIDLEQL